MNTYNLVLIPLLFGLVGFLEPCSLGINMIFLNRINGFERVKRISETLIFTFVRGTFLALFGVSAAFIGSKMTRIQSSLFLILGGIYIFFGAVAIINKYRTIFKFEVNLSQYLQNKESLALGVVFGLIIPACAISLILALIGKSLLLGNLLESFVSLFVFGVALSSPLIVISCFDKSNEIITKILEKAGKLPWLAGAALIIVGFLTLLSSSWWAGAAN
jgi:cytochrome c-type biogenesis protein